MSKVGSNFSYICLMCFPWSIGRAGARQTRRLSTLLSVGWLPAIAVECAPGTTVAGHRNAGIVCSYVFEETVRSQLNGGDVIEYRVEQSWVELLGTVQTRT